MPQETEEVKKQEVETTKIIPGKVKWFGNPNNPVPVVLARILKSLRYICTGAIAIISAAPKEVMTAEQSSVYAFWLAVAILITGGLELAVGVEPAK